MANKFLIEDLSSIALPLSGTDYTIVEQQSSTYKVSFQDIYKDVLSNRLDFKVSRSKKNGSPNILSIMFKDDDGDNHCLKKVTLQDGMLSAVKFDATSNQLSLYFNAEAVSDTIIVDLNSLEDRYFAGYGLGLSDYSDNGINGQQFYVMPSSIVEITSMSSDISSLNEYTNMLCTAIDSKLFIDGISSESLSVTHIGQNDYYQKVVTSSIVSNEIYFVSSEYINAYGTQVKNMAGPELSDDAATKYYVDQVCESAFNVVENEKANISDILYAIVALGKWEFSGLPGDAGYSSGPTYSNGTWTIYLYFDDPENTFQMVCTASENAMSLSFPYTDWGGIEGNTGTLVAMRGSLPGHLLDHTVNAVSASAATQLTLPVLVHAGKSRDFYIKMTVTGSQDVSFSPSTGITYTGFGNPTKTYSDGRYVFHFTETSLNEFCVSKISDERPTVVVYNDETTERLYISGVLSSNSIQNVSNAINVEIGNGVTSIGYEAFRGCSSLTSVMIPDSVTSIGSGAFFGCDGLTSVTIPDSVTSVRRYAFDGCSGLTNVTIPSSVTSIGEDAFYRCSGLTSVVFKGKSLAEVSSMSEYSWGITNTSIITTENIATKEWTDVQGFITLNDIPTPSYIEDSDENRINANRTFIKVIPQAQTEWKTTINNVEYTLHTISPAPGQFSWQYTDTPSVEGSLRLQLNYRVDISRWSFIVGRYTNGKWTYYLPGNNVDASKNVEQLSYQETEVGDCILNRTVFVNGEIASKDDIPTKTSDLTNDSGFITLAQVPTPAYIENDGNTINADRTWVLSRPDTANWTLNYPSVLGENVTLSYDSYVGEYWTYEGDNHKQEEPIRVKVELSFVDGNWAIASAHWDENTQQWIYNEDLSQASGESDVEELQFNNGASISRTLSGSGTLALTSQIPTKTSDITNDSGFLTQSDLPYALVSPQQTNDWVFIGSSQDGTVYTLGEPSEVDDGIYVCILYADGESVGTSRAESSANPSSWTFPGIGIVATHPYALLDRAMNEVSASTAAALTLPGHLYNRSIPAATSRSRIFRVLIDIPSSVADVTNLITFVPSGNETLHYYVEKADASIATFPVPTSTGEWAYSFQELKPGWFAVSLKQIVEVQPPTQSS